MKATAAAVLLATLAQGASTNGKAGTTMEARTPKPNGQSFTLQQVENKNFQGHDGPLALMRAYLKYVQKLPDTMLKAVDSNPELRAKFISLTQAQPVGQTGTVVSRPEAKVDSEYAVTVQIGTPPQDIPLNLDTGSSDFWTFSTDTYPNLVRGQVLYNPDTSNTSKFLHGESWSVKYGDDATAGGIVYTDRVQIGGTSVDEQAVQVAIQVSKDISSDHFVSGIIGMANGAANTVRPNPQRTYMDNVRDLLAIPLFTSNLKWKDPGNYNFGYINESEYTGDIQYAQINIFSPFWRITMDGYQFNDQLRHYYIDSIVDTGTSLVLLPQYIVNHYYSQIPGAKLDPKLASVIFPCDSKIPDFYLTLGPYRGRIPGRYISYGRMKDNYCFGGIQSSAGLPFSVLGDVFLKAQFVVFDYGNHVVGFANKNLRTE